MFNALTLVFDTPFSYLRDEMDIYRCENPVDKIFDKQFIESDRREQGTLKTYFKILKENLCSNFAPILIFIIVFYLLFREENKRF